MSYRTIREDGEVLVIKFDNRLENLLTYGLVGIFGIFFLILIFSYPPKDILSSTFYALVATFIFIIFSLGFFHVASIITLSIFSDSQSIQVKRQTLLFTTIKNYAINDIQTVSVLVDTSGYNPPLIRTSLVIVDKNSKAVAYLLGGQPAESLNNGFCIAKRLNLPLEYIYRAFLKKDTCEIIYDNTSLDASVNPFLESRKLAIRITKLIYLPATVFVLSCILLIIIIKLHLL